MLKKYDGTSEIIGVCLFDANQNDYAVFCISGALLYYGVCLDLAPNPAPNIGDKVSYVNDSWEISNTNPVFITQRKGILKML